MASAVVLLSGGLDSTTAAALARREGWSLYALTIRYGQVHAQEIEAARRVASMLGVVRHAILDVDLRAFGGSSLVGEGDIPKSPEPTQNAQRTSHPPSPAASARQAPQSSEIPSTYVPARNTVFLSLALAWAESLAAERIVIGVNALDYSGYPDCRPEFIAAFEYMASLGTRIGVEGKSVRIWAPLQHLTKAAIIRVGLELGLDYGVTSSCYDPGPDGRPCGKCESCRLRARGFAEANTPDPLLCPPG